MTTLIGRAVLITGATDGLGYALAHLLAQHGAELILHGRRPYALERAANDVRRHGFEVSTVLADFAELDQVRAMADELTADGTGIDVLGLGPTAKARSRSSHSGSSSRTASPHTR
jgi:short-subunit dehydrogenase